MECLPVSSDGDGRKLYSSRCPGVWKVTLSVDTCLMLLKGTGRAEQTPYFSRHCWLER